VLFLWVKKLLTIITVVAAVIALIAFFMGKKAMKGETNILSLLQKSRIIGAQV